MKKSKIVLLLTLLVLICLTALVVSACNQGQTEQPPTKYKLTFVVDGNEYATVTTSGSEVITMPADPAKDGYIFDGWYLDEGTWQALFTKYSLVVGALSQDLSVYANFKLVASAEPTKFNLSFVVEGVLLSTVKTAGNEVVNLPEAPLKDGYYFAGWYLDCDKWENSFSSDTLAFSVLTRDVNIYARYVEKLNPPLDDDYDQSTLTEEWKIVVDATCLKQGVEARINPDTKLTETRAILPLGHVYGEYVTTIEPTCIQEGEQVKTCFRCRNVKVETKSKTEHISGNWIVVQQNTCVISGVKAQQCTYCQTVTNTSFIPPAGHRYGDWTIVKQPTCSELGTECRQCINCNEQESVTVDNTDHTFNANEQCSVCGCSNLLYCESPNYWENTVEVTGFAGSGNTSTLVIPKYYKGKLVTSIGDSAFSSYINLTSISIAESIQTIGDCAFEYCGNLVSVTIPDSVVSIGGSAFQYCSNLTSVTIGNGVTGIYMWTFNHCGKLENVIIGNNVRTISSNAFSDCSNMTNIYYEGDIESWCNISFDYAYANPLRYADNFYIDNKLVTEVVIPDTVTEISSYVFCGCTSITSVTIPDSVTEIGDAAFSDCSSLTSVYYTGDINGWCNISFDYAYANPLCNGANLYIDNELVTELVIPDTVAKINSYAFYGCTSITSVVIPDSVTSIGDLTFNQCSKLENVIIGNNVGKICSHAFFGCPSLKTVYYMGTADDWKKISIIDGNYELTSVTRYYYSESEPELNSAGTAYNGNYWHYDENGEIEIWTKK